MGAAELAAAIRRRFPLADDNLEADLAACEEAASDEIAHPRQTLKLIQTLHDHYQQLQDAARPGNKAAQSEKIQSKEQERAS
jgi:hypothetical protein